MAEGVAAAARTHPDKPALIAHDRTVTWRALDDLVSACAAALRADLPAGPDPTGHPARVAIALPNGIDFAVTLLGVLRAGLVAVPVNPGYTGRELRHVLLDSGAGHLVSSGRTLEVFEEIRADLAHPPSVGTGAPHRVPDGAPFPTAGGEDLAVLLYTSGTEGAPKGAMLSHRALLANHEQVDRISPPVVRADDTLLLTIPLTHAYGLNSGLGAVVHHGATGVLVDHFDPAETLALIARHHVTGIVGVPSMYVAWSLLPDLGEAMATVRVAGCGAAPLDAATAMRFIEATRHPVFVGYGLTETAPIVASTLASPVPKVGSVGRPIPGVDLRLVADDGTVLWPADVRAPSDVDPDEPDLELDSDGTDPGEIVVRGANLFSGYWPDGHDGPDPDGWWPTGDLAYADAEGDLFLVDRRRELILVNGFNVYPREVELVLETHPGVAEAAVVGVDHPYTGQTVKAFLVRAPGTEATPADVMHHAERNLARFKLPTAVEFVPELPHSAIGKVRKTLLRSEHERV